MLLNALVSQQKDFQRIREERLRGNNFEHVSKEKDIAGKEESKIRNSKEELRKVQR